MGGAKRLPHHLINYFPAPGKKTPPSVTEALQVHPHGILFLGGRDDLPCFFVLRRRQFPLWKLLNTLREAQPPLHVSSLFSICPRPTWETPHSDAVTHSNPYSGQSTAPLWSYPTFGPLPLTAIDPGVFSSSMVQDALIFSLFFSHSTGGNQFKELST